MPELPEVETIRHDLDLILSGKKIKRVKVFNFKSVLNKTDFFIKNLEGRQIKNIKRRGKLLIFYLLPLNQKKINKDKNDLKFSKRFLKKIVDVPVCLIIHLKMTGQLIYKDKKIELAGGHSLAAKAEKKFLRSSLKEALGGKLPNKYTCLQISFQNTGQLFFNDLRKFGYLKLINKKELEYILKNNYGLEPLTPNFKLAAFQKLVQSKSMKIKALLLNQRLIAGLGNIYTDESLWRAKINPERAANKLKPQEIKKLYQTINSLIKQALKYRGTTFSDYLDSNGRAGNFSRFLKVYGRQGQACYNCGTIILKKKVAGRGTHYCPYCQK